MNWRHAAYTLYQATRASYLAQEKNSMLGLVWHLLNPLLMTAVLFLVFRRIEFLQSIEHYPLYILVGLIHYNFFVNSTGRAATNFLASRSLILNTTVPLELLVLRQVSIEGLTLLVEVLLVLLFGLFMGVDLGPTLLLYPVIFAGALALSLGASLFLCALVVFLSDLNYVWSLFCRVLFFLTPVFFTLELAGDGFARLMLELNPLTGLVQIARESLIYGGPVDAGTVLLALAGPLLALAFGAWVFRATRGRIPDFI